MNSEDATIAELDWVDSKGRRWALRASEHSLQLSSGEDHATFERQDWDRSIDYNEVGGGTVFRFDIDDAQVGFLVSMSQARALLEAMGWSNRQAAAQAARMRTLEQRPETWPTVTRWSMIALFGSVLSLWPTVPALGFGLAALTVVAIVKSLREARRETRLSHVPKVAFAACVLLCIALAANTLAILAPALPADAESAIGIMDVSLRSKVLAVLMVLLSLTVHEAAHALVAWWCGDEGPRDAGRITLNPISHIDPVGTIIVPVLLAMYTSMIFGWAKPVMVSLHKVPNPRRANILISAAGPAANLILSLMFLALYVILGCALLWVAPQAEILNFSTIMPDVQMSGFAGAEAMSLLAICLRWGFVVNLFLCFFNLLPIPPLDGGHVASAMFPASIGRFYARLGNLSMVILLVLFYTRAIAILLAPLFVYMDFAMTSVFEVTGF